MPTLTNQRHELFAQKLAEGKTADKAYVESGFKRHDGNAARLRGDERIKARVAEIHANAAANCMITRERVMNELAKIAFADITQAVRWGEALPVLVPAKDGDEGEGEFALFQAVELIPSDQLPKLVTAGICEVKKSKDGLGIKFHDKRAALAELNRMNGWNQENVNVTGKLTLAELVALSYKKPGDPPKK